MISQTSVDYTRFDWWTTPYLLQISSYGSRMNSEVHYIAYLVLLHFVGGWGFGFIRNVLRGSLYASAAQPLWQYGPPYLGLCACLTLITNRPHVLHVKDAKLRAALMSMTVWGSLFGAALFTWAQDVPGLMFTCTPKSLRHLKPPAAIAVALLVIGITIMIGWQVRIAAILNYKLAKAYITGLTMYPLALTLCYMSAPEGTILSYHIHHYMTAMWIAAASSLPTPLSVLVCSVSTGVFAQGVFAAGIVFPLEKL